MKTMSMETIREEKIAPTAETGHIGRPLSHSERGAPVEAVDFDLHGLVGIRLLNPTPGDMNAVSRQLGPIRAPLQRSPDITIQFVNRLPASSTLRYLGLREAGYTDDAFVLLHSKHKTTAKVQIRFEQIGGPCEITCETGLAAVPLLIPILNLAALANGALPLHASAFVVDGKGVIATGWTKGGKTEALLAFMAHGAKYIGDEWVYISQDGQRIYGIPEPVRVWDWMFAQLPQAWDRIEQKDRLRIRAVRAIQWLDRMILRKAPIPMAERVRPLLARQSCADVTPQNLFGAEATCPSAEVNNLCFMGIHDSPDIVVEPMDPVEIANRMVSSNQYERLPFTASYLAYRFAFPEKQNEFLHHLHELEAKRLAQLLADKDAWAVSHPYPVQLQALYTAMRPCIGS